MANYFSSKPHTFGCIGAIIGCVLIIIGLPLHWLPTLIIGYFLGVTLSVGLNKSFNEVLDTSSDHTIPEVPLTDNTKSQISPALQTVRSISSKMIYPANDTPVHVQLLNDFYALEQQSKSVLNARCRSLMIEISDIMQFMTQKIESSNSNEFKFEISDIQRTLGTYLNPTLINFRNLPSFLRNRKIEAIQKTPHELIEQQLQLILEEMKEIAESIYINNLNQIIDHGQYLKQKLQQESFFQVQINQDQD